MFFENWLIKNTSPRLLLFIIDNCTKFARRGAAARQVAPPTMKMTAGAGVRFFTWTIERISGMWPSRAATKNSLQQTRRPPIGHARRPPIGHARRPPIGHARRPPIGHARRPPIGHARWPPIGRARRPPIGHARRPPIGRARRPPIGHARLNQEHLRKVLQI